MTADDDERHVRHGEATPELRLLGAADVDTLAGLVFELASQLHVERQRRLALEEVLVRGQFIAREDLAALASDESFRQVVAEELSSSQRRLLDVLVETDDARRPLRAPDTVGDGS